LEPAEPDPYGEEVGLVWEATRLFGIEDLQKIVLIVPPIDEGQAAMRWEQYRVLSGGRMPPYQGGEIAATFTADGTFRVARVRVVKGRKGLYRGVSTYRSSLQVWEG
jgi:hypothetical protein